MNKVKLSEIANITTGQSPEGSTCNETGEGVPLLNGPTEFTNFYPIPKQYTTDPKKFSKAGEILFCVRGSTTGRMNWSDRSYAIGRGLASLTHKEGKELNHFLKYLIQYNLDSLLNATSGSTFPNLTSDMLASYELLVPSLSTQQKIAAVLSALDAKIELNQRINAELESMAKTLYDYWFVQFDFPNEKGKPYKSAGGKMVWNEKLNKEVPEGWQVKSLGKVLKTNLGETPSTKNPEYWDNATIPWLNFGDLTEFPIIKSSSFVTKKGVENSATAILPKGSVVISLVRYIRPSIIALEACANQSVVGIFETEEINNTFIYPFLVSEVPRLMMLRTGAQQPHINKETIDETLLCIPPANILNQYYKISKPIYEKIINCAFESQTLTELRDWLLPMLMNGQVKVSNG